MFSWLYDFFHISFNRYPEDSLAKDYRLGNRFFRPDYCDREGIPFAETIPFAHQGDAASYQALEDFFHIHQEILDQAPKQLFADVFYRFNRVTPQKTPHSCSHAARFMTMNYARQYHLAKDHRAKMDHFNKLAKDPGFNSGVGHKTLNKLFARVGLFTQAEPRRYGLQNHKYGQCPDSPDILGKILAYHLYYLGPCVISFQELNEPYGHAVLLTGVFQAQGDKPARVTYADPWEGWLIVETLESFTKKVQKHAKNFEKNTLHIEANPLFYAAGFHQRKREQPHNTKENYSNLSRP